MQITTDLNTLFTASGQAILNNELMDDGKFQTQDDILRDIRSYIETITLLMSIDNNVTTFELLQYFFDDSALELLLSKCANSYMVGQIFTKLSMKPGKEKFTWSDVNGAANSVLRDEYKSTLEAICMTWNEKLFPLDKILADSNKTILLQSARVLLYQDDTTLTWNPMIK